LSIIAKSHTSRGVGRGEGERGRVGEGERAEGAQ